ncbi:MAG: electron transport complex subunit RsxB [Gammaproteobacteria bacterium]|nr:electron transport complex subunit RsxB [Gammaproteobacteria bacterium]MDP2140401.1 electron transport complex subunit RsxB [Gammaproteobacteria bacterium]MDP2349440.1 electron transport complex subunit RsxB [Gammaproteobacteria bacterium]
MDPQAPSLSERINVLLPQTQCGKCNYAGCKPYAEAISAGDAINKCPPGGSTTIHELATLLNRDVVPLNPDNGIEQERLVAFIREAECIGCTKCIQACPVDAILGAAKQMHTVMISECTGCDLCVAPCPVDCIDMLPLPEDGRIPDPQEKKRLSDYWRGRFEFREQRLAAVREVQQSKRLAAKSAPIAPTPESQSAAPVMSTDQARIDIQAAVLRAKARKAALRRESES